MYTNFNWNWYVSYIQGHLNHVHSMDAKLCTTEHQSCQEPETLSVGHFFSKCQNSKKTNQLFPKIF